MTVCRLYIGDLNPTGLSSFSPHLIHIQVSTVSHNWSHFRQPTVHTRHCGLPRASLVAAASCNQHMGFHRLSPSSRDLHQGKLSIYSGKTIEKQSWNCPTCQDTSKFMMYQQPCPSWANHQSEVAAMVAANLDAVSAALESGDWPMGETSGDDGPSIRISMLPWASCKGIAKQRMPGEAAVTWKSCRWVWLCQPCWKWFFTGDHHPKLEEKNKYIYI